MAWKNIHCIFFGVVLYFFCGSVYAHPHVFLDAGLTYVFSEKGLEGIQMKWVFDDMYSRTILFDYDIDENMKFSRDEIETIEEESFSNLRNFAYFTYIRQGDEDFKAEEAKNFKAEVSSGRVSFNFFIPYKCGSSCLASTLETTVYDETYFTDITYIKSSPVSFLTPKGYICSYSIEDDREHSYYFGELTPKKIVMKFRTEE